MPGFMDEYMIFKTSCPELPANSLITAYDLLFPYKNPYAKGIFYMDNTLQMSRQRYCDETFCMELFQGHFWEEHRSEVILKSLHPAGLFVLAGDLSIQTDEGLIYREVTSDSCFMALPKSGRYAVSTVPGKTNILFVGMKTHWFRETFNDCENFAKLFQMDVANGMALLPNHSIASDLNEKVMDMVTFLPSSIENLKSRIKRAMRDIGLSYHGLLTAARQRDIRELEHIWEFVFSTMKKDRSLPAMDKVVANCRFTRTGLKEFCKEVSGLTPVQYFNKKRLEKARWLLLHTDMEIREIADLLLYATPSHFSDVFCHYFGLTPHEMRLDHQ